MFRAGLEGRNESAEMFETRMLTGLKRIRSFDAMLKSFRRSDLKPRLFKISFNVSFFYKLVKFVKIVENSKSVK